MLTNFMADPVEMQLLHMITADPARTPTFTMFANPDYFLFTGKPNCNKPCIQEFAPEAWNHGDVNPDINTTWLGMVGPGVKQLGIDHSIWSMCVAPRRNDCRRTASQEAPIFFNAPLPRPFSVTARASRRYTGSSANTKSSTARADAWNIPVPQNPDPIANPHSARPNAWSSART